jgi:hypothetical protein
LYFTFFFLRKVNKNDSISIVVSLGWTSDRTNDLSLNHTLREIHSGLKIKRAKERHCSVIREVGGNPEFVDNSLRFKAYLFFYCFGEIKVRFYQRVCWKY